MTANPDRGEDEIVLAGVTYLLRPSHQAIRAIEQKTEHSLIELVRLGNGMAMPMGVLGVIGAELIRAGASDDATRAVHPDRIEELIYEEGVLKATARLNLILIDAANGGRTAAGERKAAAATTSEVAGAA